jgi:hypothetical protein
VAPRRRRYAPLNFRGRPVWWYRFRPSQLLERYAWRKSDDAKAWRNLALAFIVGRQLRNMLGRSPEVVAHERLRAGERVTIVPISQRTRAERKAAKRWRPEL